MGAQARTITVTGDVTVDWMLLNPGGAPEGIEFPEIWGAGFECRAAAQPGGAAILADLVEKLVVADPALAERHQVVGPSLPHEALVAPSYSGLNRTWTSWALYPRTTADKKRHAWRMVCFWGQSCPKGLRRPRAGLLRGMPRRPRSSPSTTPISASARRRMCGRACSTRRSPREAILLKMTAPLTDGPLWRRLCARLRRPPDGGRPGQRPAQGQRAGRHSAVVGADRPHEIDAAVAFDRARQGGPRRRQPRARRRGRDRAWRFDPGVRPACPGGRLGEVSIPASSWATPPACALRCCMRRPARRRRRPSAA